MHAAVPLRLHHPQKQLSLMVLVKVSLTWLETCVVMVAITKWVDPRLVLTIQAMKVSAASLQATGAVVKCTCLVQR